MLLKHRQIRKFSMLPILKLLYLTHHNYFVLSQRFESIIDLCNIIFDQCYCF